MCKIFLDSEVIIFDVENTNLDEIKFALQGFIFNENKSNYIIVCKLGNYTHTKIFILISSPMVWSKTPPKDKVIN